MNILLLMMGGSGERFGDNIPKQYTIVNEEPLFLPILKTYDKMIEIDKIVIVSHPAWIEQVREWCSNIEKLENIVPGGINRSESVKNGLDAIASFAQNQDVILIHDATHPYVDVDGTRNVIKKTIEYGAATLANFNYDTMYRIDKNNIIEVLPRDKIVNGASPEAFLFKYIFPIYKKASKKELEQMTSAGAIAINNNIKMAFVETHILNLKITYQRDMYIYKCIPMDYFY